MSNAKFSLGLVLVLVLNLAWGFLLSRFREGNVYEVLGPLALAVVTVLATSRPATTRRLLSPTAGSVALGLVSGALMTGLVYPAYAVAIHWWPELDATVRVLYRGADRGFDTRAYFWLTTIIAAEEVLWRGRCYRLFRERLPRPAAAGLSLALYVAAQMGSGSWIVGGLALGCGLVWTALQLYTGTLVAPLLSHLVFTWVVIVLFPVI